VRISETQRQCIKEAVERQFGADARVLLFGSRVDDTARGGDIDLLVETNRMVPDSIEAVAAKLRAISEIQRRIGDRKIDMVIAGPTSQLEVVRQGREHGVLLQSDSIIANARATAESSIRECESHVSRMEMAVSCLDELFPLSEDGIRLLGEAEIARLDQFIYRFMKLQDSMATRLLPSLDTLIRADDSPRPFLDILAELEKFGIVPQETDWQFFRSLRNNLAHDDPERTAQTVATLNLLFSEWRHFAAILSRAADYYARLA